MKVSASNSTFSDGATSTPAAELTISALNAVYELQLQGTDSHLKTTDTLYKNLDEMMTDLQDTVEDTKKYREEVSKLSENLSALNTVYGNMLSAMNVMGK